MDVDINRNLIDLVSQRQLIYNSFHRNHRNKNKIDQAWREIAQDLNATVDFCQRRWRTLRTAYGKKHKQRHSIPSGSGTTLPESWPYFNQLSFLDSHVKHRSSVDNFPQPLVEPDVELPVLEETSSSLNTVDTSVIGENAFENTEVDDSVHEKENYPRGKRRRSSKEQVEKEMLSFLRDSRRKLNESPSPCEDRFDHFGKFVACHLRSQPEEISSALIKEITKMMLSDFTIEINLPATSK